MGGGNASDERGATAFSVYYDCDSSREARDYVVDVFYAEGNAAGAEFDGICSRHSDYMWDNRLPTG